MEAEDPLGFGFQRCALNRRAVFGGVGTGPLFRGLVHAFPLISHFVCIFRILPLYVLNTKRATKTIASFEETGEKSTWSGSFLKLRGGGSGVGS